MVRVNTVEKFELFLNHCKYCYYVGVTDCKSVGDWELEELKNELEDDNDMRTEELVTNNCQLEEKNWLIIIEVVVNMHEKSYPVQYVDGEKGVEEAR